jgi:hydrogenase maturation protease
MSFERLPNNPMATDFEPNILVIGYGNDLRNDDAVGQRVAERVAACQLPHVHTITIRQLTPEMAEMLATVALVIFVDVYPAAETEADVQIQEIKDTDIAGSLSHSVDPRWLLTLTRTLYGHAPRAFWVMVPGVNFEVKIDLSSVAERSVEMALQKINHLIQAAKTESCTKLA